jgi:hypothetical protein
MVVIEPSLNTCPKALKDPEAQIVPLEGNCRFTKSNTSLIVTGAIAGAAQPTGVKVTVYVPGALVFNAMTPVPVFKPSPPGVAL